MSYKFASLLVIVTILGKIFLEEQFSPLMATDTILSTYINTFLDIYFIIVNIHLNKSYKLTTSVDKYGNLVIIAIDKNDRELFRIGF